MLNVPLLAQHDRPDCLAVCAEMILRFHGMRVGRERLRRMIGTTNYGTPAPNIQHLAQIGIDVEFGSSDDPVTLDNWLRRGHPPICMIDTGALPYWGYSTAHAVVLVELDEKFALLNDPAYADDRQRVTRDAFLLAWADHDYQYAILQPR